MSEEKPVWPDILGRGGIPIFCLESPDDVIALGNYCMQAGCVAYAEDNARGALLPHASPDAKRQSTLFASKLLAEFPLLFGDAFPLRQIRDWWWLGYEQQMTCQQAAKAEHLAGEIVLASAVSYANSNRRGKAEQ